MTRSTYPASRRAAVLSDFGEADNLSVREIATPAIRSDELLVRVKATSVNPIEWKMRRGLRLPVPKPIWRLLLGRPMILGIDFAGTVAAAGTDVDGYRIGDDVMGAFRFAGADAEYAVVRPADSHTAVAHKPPSLSHVEAAGVPLAALTAWGLIVETAHAHEGQRILIHAGGGGVGHFAVQFAAYFGAHVIATASPHNASWLRELGAAEVIDYAAAPFESQVSGVMQPMHRTGQPWSLTTVRLPGPSITLPCQSPAMRTQSALASSDFEAGSGTRTRVGTAQPIVWEGPSSPSSASAR